MDNKFIFTSESVTEGHPDKVADQISDAVLDAFLKQDQNSKVACETLIKSGLVVLAGEVSSKASIDYQKVIKEKIKQIGYTSKKCGFDVNQCSIIVNINNQSPDIAQGIDKKKKQEQGAGDQGLMFGYAVDETKEFMPMPIALAHAFSEQLAMVRKQGILSYLKPDGKTQVSLEYKDGKVKRIDTVVVSAQHEEQVSLEKITNDIKKEVIMPIIPIHLVDKETKFFINPTGKFVIGGPESDAGITGRKIIVDTYGGMGRHGGGAFSGKDSSKVDRSAAYVARYIAKNIVASNILKECEVQLSYAIGIAEPVSININSFANVDIDKQKLALFIRKNFPLKPADIIQYFNLKEPIFSLTSSYGHFGRRLPEFAWEKTDIVEKIKREFL